jgi:uncharacterized protein (DUF2147 family)
MPDWYLMGLSLCVAWNDISLIAAAVVTAAAVPAAVRQQVPEGNQNDRADQCLDEGNTVKIVIGKTGNNDDLRHQPDSYEGRDNCTDEAKREPPADNEFCYQTDNSRDNEVHDKIRANRPDVVPNLNGDAIGENGTVDKKMKHVPTFQRRAIVLTAENTYK